MDIQQLEKNLERVHEWIRAADQKVSILLVFEGIFLITFISTVFEGFQDSIRLGSLFLARCYALILIIFIWSVVKCFIAIYPRLKHDHKKVSPLYFRDIASIKFDSFKNKMKNMSEDDYRDEIYKQIYSCAVVADRKYVAFRDSLMLAFFSIGIFLILELCQKIMNS